MKKRTLSVLAIVIVFLLGIGFIAYPFISNWIAQNNRYLEMLEYDRSIEEMEEEQLRLEWEKAEAFNHGNKRWQSTDAFSGGDNEPLSPEYLSLLNIDNMMGYIEIPTIDVYLPIKHGTTEKTLSTSIGHLARSNLPIGGDGNHTVLTGHTALPSAILFSNLSKLVLGDMFYLHILDKTLAYKIDDILVVEPQNVDTLYPVSGEDYVTLITCTPYGVNSHRLLVRGTKVDMPAEETFVTAQDFYNKDKLFFWIFLLFMLSILVFTFAVFILISLRRKKREEKHDKTKR